MSYIAGVAKGVVLCCDLFNMVDGLNKVQEEASPDVSLVYKAYLINRMIILGFVCTEIGLQTVGAKTATLELVKGIEVLPRMADVFVKAAKEAVSFDGSLKGGLQIFEKGFVAPMMDLSRDIAEIGVLEEQHFLDMTPEELSHAKRYIPIDEDHGKWVPVDRKDCEERKAAFEEFVVMTSFVRGAAEAGAVGATVCTTGNLYRHLARYTQDLRRWMENRPAEGAAPQRGVRVAPAPQVPVPPPQAQAAAPPAAPVNGPAQVVPPHEGIDLVNLPFIPPLLHSDYAFRRCCCITQLPIRDPVAELVYVPSFNNNPAEEGAQPPRFIRNLGGQNVADSSVYHLYEREAILEWLRRPRIVDGQILPQVSPMTNLPLTADQLIPKSALKAFIDHRLKFHQDQLEAYMQSPEFLSAPSDEALETAADLENPNRYADG